MRVTVKGQRNKKGAPLRTDFGLGGADVVTLNQARERALELPDITVICQRTALSKKRAGIVWGQQESGNRQPWRPAQRMGGALPDRTRHL